jgi:hypothetical protein
MDKDCRASGGGNSRQGIGMLSTMKTSKATYLFIFLIALGGIFPKISADNFK